MKKILSALMICVILASSLAPCTLADGSELSNEEPLIEPRYEVIYTISTTLNISDSGRAECYASVRIPSGYEVDLLAELQQKNGNRWETIHDWEDSGSERVSVSGPWYVMSGYSYRLKVTATTYDAAGTFVEAPVEYSTTVDY